MPGIQKNERVLITGATGFLGIHTASYLQNKGIQVTGIGRNRSIGKKLIERGISFEECSLSDLEKLKRIFSKHTYIIHCAALSSAWGRYEDFYESNVLGTANVIEAARSSNVKRLVHVSTPSLYVTAENKLGLKETDALPEKPINFYAKTKRMGEELVDLAFISGLETITIRPQGIFGPGDTSILPRLVRLAKKGVIPVIGKEEHLIDMTYVDNVAHALYLCLEAESNCLGKKYNITNDEPINNSETLIKLVQDLGFHVRTKHLPFAPMYALGLACEWFYQHFIPSKEPLLTRYSVCVLGKSRTLDITRAKNDLGYSPLISMDEGLKRYTQWWKSEMT